MVHSDSRSVGPSQAPAAQSHYRQASIYSLNRAGYYRVASCHPAVRTGDEPVSPAPAPVHARPPARSYAGGPEWQAITLHLRRPRARQEFGIGVAVTSFVNHDSRCGALMLHRWRVGACPPVCHLNRRVTGSLPVWGDRGFWFFSFGFFFLRLGVTAKRYWKISACRSLQECLPATNQPSFLKNEILKKQKKVLCLLSRTRL